MDIWFYIFMGYLLFQVVLILFSKIIAETSYANDERNFFQRLIGILSALLLSPITIVFALFTWRFIMYKLLEKQIELDEMSGFIQIGRP